MERKLVVLDLRHRVPSGISEYALETAPGVVRELRKLGLQVNIVVANHQLARASKIATDGLILATSEEHYVHFDASLAGSIQALQPAHIHSFGPLTDPRWAESFSVTWHDVMRLQVEQLRYDDDEVVQRTSRRELEYMSSFDRWCSQRFGLVLNEPHMHARTIQWNALLARHDAKFVAAVSSTSASEVQQVLGLEKLPEIVRPAIKSLTIPATFPRWVKDLHPFFLFVGAPDIHKRLDLVCSSLLAAAPDARVVVVGNAIHEPLSFRLRKHFASAALLDNSRILRRGYVSDAELGLLYSSAIATVIPSTHEGYCLPAAECASVGGRLIANDIPAIRETVGSYRGVWWFDLNREFTLLHARDAAMTRRQPLPPYTELRDGSATSGTRLARKIHELLLEAG